MMTRKLAVAVVATAGIALQAAFLHLAVVTPLGSALSDLRAAPPAPTAPVASVRAPAAGTFEETIEVVAKVPVKRHAKRT